MANLPSPDHAADLPNDELINPEPAPIILYHAPAQTEGYVGNNDIEDDEEEDPNEDPEEELIEQIIPEQNNMDGFALHMNPQPTGNMNGWLIKDDDEEVEEDGEVINAYEEVDPLNRPPHASDEETKFAPLIVLIVDVDDEPIPPASDLESVHRRTKKLEKQLFDRYKTEMNMAKKLKEDEFRMNRHEYDITALDPAVRENRSDHSKRKKFVLGLSRQFKELKEQNRWVKLLSQWEAGVRGRIPTHLRFWEESPIYTASASRADDPYVMVRDAAMAAREDDDDDITTPRDPQPSELCGSPRDS
ncbi:hypothetical protein Tco_0378129 [Tanacetum coccineum]